MDEVIITVQLAGDLSQPPEVEEVREGGVETLVRLFRLQRFWRSASRLRRSC